MRQFFIFVYGNCSLKYITQLPNSLEKQSNEFVGLKTLIICWLLLIKIILFMRILKTLLNKKKKLDNYLTLKV